MKRMHVAVVSAVGTTALVLGALGARAQESGTAVVAPTRNVGEYAGVKPGADNPPPRLARVQAARDRARLLTWPGFEMRSAGSRFFLQLSHIVPVETRSSNGRFEVLLRGVTTHLRNTRRPLVTRYFNTPVISARVERRGRHDLAMVFELRADVTPRISNAPGANGFYFIFIDFPPGQYLEGAAPPSADDRPSSSTIPAADDERPPPVVIDDERPAPH